MVVRMTYFLGQGALTHNKKIVGAIAQKNCVRSRF